MFSSLLLLLLLLSLSLLLLLLLLLLFFIECYFWCNACRLHVFENKNFCIDKCGAIKFSVEPFNFIKCSSFSSLTFTATRGSNGPKSF